MTAWLMRLLVLCNALLLVPPPGWCCASLSPQPEKPAPVKGCCPCAPEKEQTPADPPPVRPEMSCCCRIDSTSPPPPEDFTPDLTSVPLPTVALDPGAGHSLRDGPSFAAFSPHRSLQLLHCVWRC
jgi:hypothetical protein